MLFTSTRFALLSDAALAVALVFPCLQVASAIRRKLHLPEVFLFSLVLLLAGLAAEAIFFITMVNTEAAQVVAWVSAAIGSVLTFVALRDERFRDELKQQDSWAPFAATAGGGFAFLAIFCISFPGTAASLTFAQTWLLNLPEDNILPHLLAQHIAMHLPSKPFFGEWLSSDRPPLQAGFELLLSAFTPFVKDVDARYQALGMLLQASSFGMLFTVCRLCGCTGLRAGAVVLLFWLSGFSLINTEFVWPKLIAAAFVAVGLAICLVPGRLTVQRAIVVGSAVALGLLSHGGVVFTLPALVVTFIAMQRRGAFRPLAVAFGALLVVYAPWIWYQKAFDPPGDRLLKWHLAGQIAPTDLAFVPTIYHAYTGVPFTTIVHNKIANLETLFGLTLGAMPWRAREFFYVGYALGALMLCFIAALCLVRATRRPLRMASRFAWISVASLLFWALVLYLPNGDVVHVGSYLTMMLMFAAGGMVAVEWPALFAVVVALQAYDFGEVWLSSVDCASVITPSGCLALFVLAGIAGSFCAASARHVVNIGGKSSTALKDGDTLQHPSKGRQEKDLTAKWLPTGIWLLIAVVLPIVVVLTRLTDAGAAARVNALEAGIPRASTSVPNLSKIARHTGRAVVSLDAVVIDGSPTVVAALKSRRTFRVASKDTIVFTGWAFDPAAGAPAGGLTLRVGGRDEPAGYGFSRQDVASFFKSPNLVPVGFNARVHVRDLRPGANAVSLIVISNNRKSYYVNPSDVVIDRH